tara:strand:- start:506 stop:916 length:411 start_codon:yes stop_codon:yes gene_type:complete
LSISFSNNLISIGFEITTATSNAIKNLGNETKKLFKIELVVLRLITIYLSKLNITADQKKDPRIIYKEFSKIRLNAKKEDTNANMQVNRIVNPIEEYLMISKFGHFKIKSLLTPEQNNKRFVIGSSFLMTIKFVIY